METKLFSSLQSSANNIVKMKRSLPKRARDYDDFINWLDTSNKDIKKIKLPKKKKVEDLQFSVGSALGGGGGGGGGLLNLLLGGAAGVGARFLGKGIKAVKGFGKNAISKIFPKSAGSATKKAAVPAADIAKKGVVTGADDAAKIAAMKGGGKLASKGGELAAKLIPGLATAVNLGTSAYRFSQGDVVGGSLSLASAIPFLGWAAVGVDVAREFGAFEGTPLGLKKEKPKNKIDERLKAQETKQREAASASNVTFESITDKFDKVVSKFEKLKLGMTGVQNKNGSNAEIEDSDSIEPTNPIDTGNKPEPTGLQLEDVEASGGEVPGAPNSGFRSARRPGHNGNDYFKSAGTPISLIQEGTVAVADMNWDPTGWGAVVEVRHKDGSLSRYAHLSKISVSVGSKISPGQVIGYTGGAVGAPGAGNSEGEHLHFEYLPAGSDQVDPTEAAKRIFRFGGSVKVKAKKGGNQGAPDPKINTIEKQQSIEDFIKGTKSGDRILNDPKLKAQLTGEKYQFKNTMVKTPVSDPEVKQAQQNYNAYVRDIRSRQQDQVKAQTGDQIPAQILTPPPTAAQQSAIFLMGDQSQQVASQPQVVPIPIGNGGGGGVTVIMPSEGQILNSLWTTMLLTNLSSA
jgi:murein DD-endopeptidase MepM/ murein hydrolase activator NlpD